MIKCWTMEEIFFLADYAAGSLWPCMCGSQIDIRFGSSTRNDLP